MCGERRKGAHWNRIRYVRAIQYKMMFLGEYALFILMEMHSLLSELTGNGMHGDMCTIDI